VSRGERLLAWYGHEGRDLPWRQTRDPYRILVSEVMAQQTQLSRVVRGYERFLDRFPTVGALASAPLHAVLSAWAGLGYNTRARRLREAARVIVRDGWPTDRVGLGTLPGVGAYTASAVAAFAFGEKVAVTDTNVRRVLSRWTGVPLAGADLRSAAQSAITGDAAYWNQAIMDLGAMVCRPTPDCERCPVRRWCADPGLYRPPPRQSPFRGSDRQVRGAVLRSLDARRWNPMRTIAAASGYEVSRVEAALRGLAHDGMVEVRGRSARIAP
jgi:A/G-specific adenine glycosylase